MHTSFARTARITPHPRTATVRTVTLERGARNLTGPLLAVRCCSGRTMKQCMSDLRDGWYGCDNYHKWIREGRPIGRGPVGTGEVLSVEQRRAAAQHRFGKGKSEDDWIPSDCCRPSNVAGLIEKAKGEAEAMIAKTDGLSGTLADLVKRESQPAADDQTVTHRWVPDPTYVDPSAILVEPHTRDMSDLTGLPQEICDLTGLSAEVVGHDDRVSEEAGDISGSQDRPGIPVATIDGDDELQVGASSEGDEHCLGCGALMPRDSMLAFCSRCE
jgi:hypothetical protein